MADIDELQIQIEADSSDAAEGISALISSVNELASAATKAASGLERFSKAISGLKSLSINTDFRGALESLQASVSMIPQIADTLKGSKINKSSFNNIDNLSKAVEELDRVEAPTKFAVAVATIASAASQLNELDIEKGITNVLRLSPALESLSNALQNMSTATNRFMETTHAIRELAAAIGIISNTNIDGAENIREYLEAIQRIEIKPEFSTMLDSVGRAITRLSNAKPNEAAADALRLLIDTVRIITEEDLARLRELSTLLQGLSGFKMPRTVILNNPVEPGTEESLESVGDAIDDVSRTAGESGSRFEAFREAVNALGRGAVKAVSYELRALTAPIRAVGNAFSRAASKVSQFLASVKRILLYRAIRSILKSIAQGLQEGRENLYQYSLVAGTDFARSMDKAATAFLYLKNSLAAATAPLTNYLVPVLDHIIDRVVDLVNAFNEMTAALTGAATWTRAIKYPTQWQEAADDATKAAKKLKSTILGFDELNVIEPKDTSKGKNKLTADDYRKMFEEVKTNYKMTSGVSELVMPIKLAWDAEGDNTIKAVKNSFREILDLFGSIGNSLKTVWTNGTGQETLETILRITQNIVGTFGNLAKSIRKAWDENGRGTKIIQNLWSAGNNVLKVFENLWSSTKEWAAGLNFAPLLDGFGSLSASLKRLTDPNGGLAKLATSVLDKFLLPVGKVIIEDALPGAVELLSGAFDGLAVALEFIEPILSRVVGLLEKVASFTFTNIGGLASGFGALFQAGSGKEISNSAASGVEKAAKAFENIPGEQWIEKNVGGFLYDLIGDKNQTGYAGKFGEWLADQFMGDGGAYVNSILKDENVQREIKKFLDNEEEYVRQFKERTIEIPAIPVQQEKPVENYEPNYGGIDYMFGSYEQPDMADYSEAVEESSSAIKDFQENWSAGMETISDKFESFGKSWKSGWNDIGDWTSKKWTKITDAFSTGWQGVKTFFANFSNNWKSGWKDVSEWGSQKWSSIRETLGTGWDTLKSKVSDWRDNWNNGLKDVKSAVSEKWDSIKSKLGEGWESIRGNLLGFVNNFGSGMSAIASSARDKWEFIKSKFAEGWTDWAGKLKGWKDSWVSGMDTIWTKVYNIWNSIKNHLSSGWQTVKDKVTDYFKSWTSGFEDIKKWYQDSTIGKKISSTWDKVTSAVKAFIPGFASGGTIDSGQLFIAREAGAELVGNIGGQTAVMNNQQIVQAVSSGVAQAVASVMSQVMAQNNSGGGDINLVVNLDGRQIAASVEKAQKSKGVSILGGVSYAT